MSEETDVLTTLRDFIRWGVSRFEEAGLFYGHGTDNALDEATLLVLHALHLPSDLTVGYLDARLTVSERAEVLDLLQRRVDERLPAAYLMGATRFAGLDFYVNRHVLIPRSPIAELIESNFEPWIQPDTVERILDLCTGSGCIAIGCAYSFPDSSIDAVDLSAEALRVAQINIERHQLETRVEPLLSDLFEKLKGRRYNLIVSNPPYVSLNEMETLPAEYLKEPAIGLKAGTNGLDVVIRILQQAADYLEPGGILVVETGNNADLLTFRYPQVPFLWLEFERGGEGVFLLTVEQLCEYQSVFTGATEL